MTEFLSAGEAELAAQAGWRMCDVLDLDRRVWRLMILPITISGNSVQDTLRAVQERAKSHDQLSLKALRLIVHTPTVRPHNEAPTRRRRKL